ncbi:eukaryotic translation initiation factor 3 subunit K [Coniochaeta ligniaria NRRL 30616]|uniref:Eukaryotic translation initiation factor 3 subunit K n=1 Tax=Coniochaeta ligniaria NRRL 30616 TaxID=1408157 RepID=A0A1J7II04_9PEZI|nr:eukaryotic translation initiation factor 3 subunit K [Coniochaeta ligniaria NRRL 30616]
MNGEDPQERPELIKNIINGLERYNPEAAGTLESYLQEQCDQKFCDASANRALLKLYQLNPDRINNEAITNTLVKCMTLFPSPQFDLALHLLSPAIANPSAANAGSSTSELAEAVAKLRALNAQLEGAQYARFWATMDSDDLYADLTTDIAGFEEMIRVRIAQLVSQAFREVNLSVLEAWLGINDEAEARKYVTEACGWKVDADGVVQIPRNPENEAKKAEIREYVNVDMFSRVIRRAWEAAA